MPSNVIGSYNLFVAITKSDTVNIVVPFPKKPAVTDAIYVGASGDIAAVMENGTAVTLASAIAGTIIPIAVKRVNSTLTTADNLVALYSV